MSVFKKVAAGILGGFLFVGGVVSALFGSVIIHLSGADKHDTWPSLEEMKEQSSQWNDSIKR